MASHNPPLEPRITADDERRPARSGSSWFPFIVSAIVAVVIMAIVFPHSFGIVGINPRTSVQTVANQPTSETTVVAPMPGPTSEPRPTQAPIQ
jgi:hypothetical protein